ncbi:LacI family DNA-binding transcriptional regulator [Aureimonas fodinaquatilis]|nr:LacI family DNA-binding transcriptional regulator [Aureimonas fodinaquatilis]
MSKSANSASGGRITMDELAALAGVSPATVSRVYSAPDRVSEATRSAVLSVAERHGFHPNRLAGSLRNSKTRIVGIIVPSLTTSFFAQTLQSLSRALEAMDYRLMVCSHDYDLDREEQLLQTLLEWSPSAIVTTGTAHTRRSLRLMLDAPCPIVEMWDLADNPVDTIVGFSNREVGVAVAHHLWRSGRRNLAFVGRSLERDQRGAARCSAFVDTIEQLGGQRPQVIALPDQSTSSGGAEAFARLAIRGDIDAVAFSNDILALGGLAEAQRLGISVPQDIAVVGYGDLEFAPSLNPALTTVRLPQKQIGEQVAAILAQRFANGSSENNKIDLGFELVIRASG